MNTVVGIIVVLLLVAANAFFVAVEFALVAADRAKLDARAADGSWSAKIAVAAVRRMSFHLSGAQLGITISSLVLGFLIEPLVATLLEPALAPVLGTESTATIVVALVIATTFQMVAGELIPKNMAIANAETMAMRLAPIARVVHGAFSPVIFVFNGAANWAVRRMGIEPQEELTSVRSLEEIEYLIRSSGETGSLDPEALQLLTRTLRFGDKTAADALVPRVHVKTLLITATVGELIELSREVGHSRYPVVVDDLDDVVGVVSVTDVFGIDPPDRHSTPISDIVREPRIVPETRGLADILDDFRGSDTELILVVDEHGGTAGIVTLEDVLEEITGDIDDEYDREAAPDAGSNPGGRGLTIGRRAGVAAIAGTLHRDEVVDAVGFDMPDGGYETIAGFLLDRFGRIPEEGDRLIHDGWSFEVATMEGLRIASIQVLAPSPVGSA